MKKNIFFLFFSLTPLIIGALMPFLFQLTVVGKFFYYFMPLFFLFFWCWIGHKFAASNLSKPSAALFAHAPGLLLFAVYCWQFVFLPAPSNAFLANISTMYTAPVFQIVLWLSVIFEPIEGTVTQVSTTAGQIISLALFFITFVLGYQAAKKGNRHFA